MHQSSKGGRKSLIARTDGKGEAPTSTPQVRRDYMWPRGLDLYGHVVGMIVLLWPCGYLMVVSYDMLLVVCDIT